VTKILVVNQHGGNRGDEAACRGMLYGLKYFVPDAEITVLTVYPLRLDGLTEVTLLENLPLRGLAGWRAIYRKFLYLVGFYTGLRTTTQHAANVLSAFRQADLIISAPGGPYIGDLYSWTEPELLFHILLGTLTASPTMIYAPSMGPFQCKSSNWWRKSILKRVDLITVRESISAQYLSEQGIHLPGKYITVDSALQRPVDAGLGDLLFARWGLTQDKTQIGFVPLELSRFECDDKKVQYVDLLVQTLRLLARHFTANFVFFPQGYGVWRDRPFIESVVSIAGIQDQAYILPDSCTSDEQQALVGKMDAFISFRYHPGIFALRQSVPCVSVAYEHKMRGFMQALGMEEFCLDLETVTAPQLVDKLAQAWHEREAIAQRVQPRIRALERESLKNSFLASLLLKYHSKPRAMPLDAFVDEQLRSGEWWVR
jgi:colanic acid/amylovoran biosynthesis protein